MNKKLILMWFFALICPISCPILSKITADEEIKSLKKIISEQEKVIAAQKSYITKDLNGESTEKEEPKISKKAYEELQKIKDSILNFLALTPVATQKQLEEKFNEAKNALDTFNEKYIANKLSESEEKKLKIKKSKKTKKLEEQEEQEEKPKIKKAKKENLEMPKIPEETKTLEEKKVEETKIPTNPAGIEQPGKIVEQPAAEQPTAVLPETPILPTMLPKENKPEGNKLEENKNIEEMQPK